MDTEFAATLVTVIREGSITGAARRLGLTPGAVSLRVKTLETELGTALLARAGRNVAPTRAATRLLSSLEEIIAQTADLKRLVSEREILGELRLGTIGTASTGILPPLLRRLTTTAPGLEIFVDPGVSVELCEWVSDGRLDAAIIGEPPYALRKGEEFTPWVAEPLILVAPPHLADRAPMDLITQERFIRYDRRNWGGRIVDQWLKARGVSVRDHIELDALDGIVAMVAAGLGVAIVPDWSGPRPAGATVATMVLPPPAAVRRVGLYHRRQSRRQDLIDLLTPAFEASFRR